MKPSGNGYACEYSVHTNPNGTRFVQTKTADGLAAGMCEIANYEPRWLLTEKCRTLCDYLTESKDNVFAKSTTLEVIRHRFLVGYITQRRSVRTTIVDDRTLEQSLLVSFCVHGYVDRGRPIPHVTEILQRIDDADVAGRVLRNDPGVWEGFQAPRWWNQHEFERLEIYKQALVERTLREITEMRL